MCELGMNLMCSALAPWQRIDALKAFFFRTHRADSAFTAAWEAKCSKYEPLIPLYQAQGLTATVVPFLVGALGSWYPWNDKFLKAFCANSDIALFHALQILAGIPPTEVTLRSLTKLYHLRYLQTDLQINNQIYSTNKLEERPNIEPPWYKQKFKWRHLNEEGGYYIYTDGS
ncbi:hypothetical protein CEXT_352121 [Caerostris extrusa]|uniref:Uncharacterized protein n=1 Tax=Caerostris extrusa TaxID=172846 RepID=A0AAV4WJL4_CAEEX|nr:hypothetical protein CEXT_352121 [Caerostris extrusa]